MLDVPVSVPKFGVACCFSVPVACYGACLGWFRCGVLLERACTVSYSSVACWFAVSVPWRAVFSLPVACCEACLG